MLVWCGAARRREFSRPISVALPLPRNVCSGGLLAGSSVPRFRVLNAEGIDIDGTHASLFCKGHTVFRMADVRLYQQEGHDP